MRIGICGGTFDPFHRGHLDPILAVRESMGWDEILYVPAFLQPFKSERLTVSGYHRFAMAVLATQGLQFVYVSTQELERGAISYTVDTLQEMRAAQPSATLDWIIGDDNLAELEKWREIERIFELANFAVLSRIGAESCPTAFRSRVRSPEERDRSGSIVFAHNPTVAVSSTEIRMRIRTGQSIAPLVDPRVSQYIQHNRLYREVQR